uniref:proto-oncogene tyrosine-protein kinase receptor Ret n=1 Tax=Myxine glutinosa TaxID=7769 RepID=UPI00358E37D9
MLAPLSFFTALLVQGVASLYLPRCEFKETIYLGQPEGSAIVRLFAFLGDSHSSLRFERPWMLRLEPMSARAVMVNNSWFCVNSSGVVTLCHALHPALTMAENSTGLVPPFALTFRIEVTELSGGHVQDSKVARIRLSIKAGSVPPCSRIPLMELCFGNSESQLHVQENGDPGAVAALSSLPLRGACSEKRLSYRLMPGQASSLFHINESSGELSVTHELDREHTAEHTVSVQCRIDHGPRTDILPLRSFVVWVDDVNDNPLYLGEGEPEGGQIREIVFNRHEDDAVAKFVFLDRDSTGDECKSSLKRHGCETWADFDVKCQSQEKKTIVENRTIVGLSYDYTIFLKQNITINISCEVQMELTVSDVNSHAEVSSIHVPVNVTIRLLNFTFPTPELSFQLARGAQRLAQFGHARVADSDRLQTAEVEYQMVPEEPQIGDEPWPCLGAVDIVRDTGMLFVSNAEVLRLPTCQHLQFEVRAWDRMSGVRANASLKVVLQGQVVEPNMDECFTSCSEHQQRSLCEACSGIGALTGFCHWRQGPAAGISRNFSTCSPNLLTCPDGICDEIEANHSDLCPQDCVGHEWLEGGYERGYPRGIVAGHGTCHCYTGGDPRCICESDTPVEHQICNEGCRVIVTTSAVCLVLFLFSITVACLRRCHRKVLKTAVPTAELTFRRPNSTFTGNNNRPPHSDSSEALSAGEPFKIPDDPKWEFPRKNLVLGKTLGEGEFGKVVKATAFCLKGKAGYTTVAVKMLKDCASQSELRDLLSELNLLKQVSHPNIIKLHGACTQGGPLYLIVDYARFGSLRSFLRTRRKLGGSVDLEGRRADRGSQHLDIPDQRCLTLGDLVSFAWQISRGMQYLAEMKLVHRDLAARNVLVAEGRKMKVSDFGLSRDVYEGDSYVKRTKGRIPVKWMAIESLFDHMYTTQSDVWSFGVLLWEIVTLGGTPYPGIPPERLFNLLKSGYRMDRPDACSEELYGLMLRCWKPEPEKRPTFSEISKEMEKLMVKSRDYLDLAAPTPADESLYDDGASEDEEEETPLVDGNHDLHHDTESQPTTWIENKLYGVTCPDWPGDGGPLQLMTNTEGQLSNKPANNILDPERYANWMVSQSSA